MKKWIFILTVVLLIIAFFPKATGKNAGMCIDCEKRICKCFGIEKKLKEDDPHRSTCYGLLYNCKST